MNAKEYAAIYRSSHKELLKAYFKKYRETHREEIRIKARNHYRNNKERIKARTKKYYEGHKEKRQAQNRELNYLRRYGLTTTQRADLIAQRNNLCDICRDVLQKPQIDHDHKTNRVRGVLCFSCNRLLGDARDSINILEQAIRYLRHHG